MSARQLIVLAVAIIAAIGAIFLVRGMNTSPAPREAEAVQVPGEQVLVATRDVPQGVALSASDVTARLFPQDSVNVQFIRAAQTEAVVGAVTRRPFLQGEPIVEGSIVMPDGRGFMAAQLEPGYRAVAVEIEDQTAAGNFIQPNDRVDVISTARLQGEGGRESFRSTLLLADVRVLAIGEAVQPAESEEGPERVPGDVAVLELSARDAEILAQADAMGTMTLALRGVENEPPGLRAPSAARSGAPSGQSSGTVRVHAYGVVSEGGAP